MKVTIDKDLCVGCGLCVSSCPDVFEMEEDKAVAKANPVPKESTDCAQEAAQNCPVEAIKIS
jgi:ferredoxin